MAIKPNCHPRRAHKAFNLCVACWQHLRYMAKKQGLKPSNIIADSMRPPDCHPDKPYYANGLCLTCYHRGYQKAYKKTKRAAAKEQKQQIAYQQLP